MAQSDVRGEETQLCPYDVYCPKGPKHIPFGGTREDEDISLAPIADYPGGWVQVGTSETCEEFLIMDEAKAVEDEEQTDFFFEVNDTTESYADAVTAVKRRGRDKQ